MASNPRPWISPEQYLKVERQAETKSEYLNGETFAMTGASRRHNLVAGNIFASLKSQLRDRGCEVYISDMRVRIPVGDFYVYPDVTVACGQPRFEDSEVDTLLNPVVIVEILSKSTEDYDRGTKFVHYRTLPSLAEYLLVSQEERRVEHLVRQASGWLLTESTSLEDVVELPSVGARLALSEIYDRVP